jgi:hypothetical protein
MYRFYSIKWEDSSNDEFERAWSVLNTIPELSWKVIKSQKYSTEWPASRLRTEPRTSIIQIRCADH